MRNIKIIYSYDGSMFFGSQRQPDKRTVQGEIEALLKIICKEEINLITSGRTDRGVHALFQVSNFLTTSKIPLPKLEYVLRRGLPMDIELKAIEEVEKDFNSRFDAKEREYTYIMSWEKNPFRYRYETYINQEIDREKFANILKPLIGVHNFNNFRLSDCDGKSSIREIYSIKIEKINSKSIAVKILGNSFLKSQIRIIIGTGLEIYFGKREEGYIKEMLENPYKQYIKKVAEPNGLYLSNISY